MKTLALMALLALNCFLAGCTPQPPQTPSNLAIVYGYHSNNAQPNITKAMKSIKEICESSGTVSIITVDGKPFSTVPIDIPVQTKQLTSDKKEEIAEKQTKEIVSMLKNSTAKTEGANPLSAITLAGRALKSQTEGERKMLILDSGISTTGELDFSKCCLDNINIKKVVKQLKQNNAIPDLNNISIIWTGLGDTCSPQAELSAVERSRLKDLWTAILSESGADVTFTDDLPSGEIDSSTLPHVDTVPTIQTTAILEDENFTGSTIKDKPVALDDETVHFKPGSSKLLTGKKKVCKVLNSLICYMKKHPDYKILLAGTTASAGTQEELVELSKERCETLKKILINTGVNEKQIKTVGLGYKNHPYYTDDINDDGSLNEKNAKKNRSVIIMDYESEEAKKLR